MFTEKERTSTNEHFTDSNDTTASKDFMYSRTDRPFGISWEEWTTRWWKWILSIPKENNPGFDPTGERFCFSEQFQEEHVIFLVGTFGGTAERTYNIPEGRSVLLPIINFTFCSKDEPSPLSDEELQIRAQNDIDDIVEKQASIDGKRISEIEKYRVKTKAFDIVYPKNNVFGVSDGSTRAVSDGYWIFLKPMQKSSHILYVSGSCSSGKTKLDVTLHLNVI
jgi:hypothetical protein